MTILNLSITIYLSMLTFRQFLEQGFDAGLDPMGGNPLGDPMGGAPPMGGMDPMGVGAPMGGMDPMGGGAAPPGETHSDMEYARRMLGIDKKSWGKALKNSTVPFSAFQMGKEVFGAPVAIDLDSEPEKKGVTDPKNHKTVEKDMIKVTVNPNDSNEMQFLPDKDSKSGYAEVPYKIPKKHKWMSQDDLLGWGFGGGGAQQPMGGGLGF